MLVAACALAASFLPVGTARAADLEVPDGYVLQVLDATDGRVARPRDWHYRAQATANGRIWTIAAEDPAGPWDTGWRMQLFVNVKNDPDWDTRRIARLIADNKRREVARVLSDSCSDQPGGDFQRICLDVIEERQVGQERRRYRVVYSVFRSDHYPFVAVTSFGAPEAQWEAVQPILRAMQPVQVIGPNFGKGAPAPRQ